MALNSVDRQTTIARAFKMSCALVVAALPFGIKFTSYAIAIMVISWIIQGSYRNILGVIKTNRFFWLFSGLYLLMAVSIIYTQDIKSALWEMEKGAALLIFPLLLASSPKLPLQAIRFILRTFILSNLLFGVICLGYAAYKYLREEVNLFFNFDLVNLFNGHPTYYSMFILFSLAALFYLNSNRDKRDSWENKPSIIVLIALFFTVIIFLLSVRFIFLLFILIGLIAIVFYVRKTGHVKLGLLGLFIFIFIIFIAVNKNEFLKERLLQLKNYRYELSEETMEGYNGLTTRLAQWESSIPIIKGSPFFGVGPGDVQAHLQMAYKKNFLKYSYRDRLNAHNQYVQTLLGLGVVGLIVFLANLVVPGILAFKQQNFIYVFFILLFALCCITESMLYVQKGIVFFSFFNSLFGFHILDSNGSKIP